MLENETQNNEEKVFEFDGLSFECKNSTLNMPHENPLQKEEISSNEVIEEEKHTEHYNSLNELDNPFREKGDNEMHKDLDKFVPEDKKLILNEAPEYVDNRKIYVGSPDFALLRLVKKRKLTFDSTETFINPPISKPLRLTPYKMQSIDRLKDQI